MIRGPAAGAQLHKRGMGWAPGSADLVSVKTLRLPSALVVGALATVALGGVSSPAIARQSVCTGAGGGGYTYAGHQATYEGHGVRARITALRTPQVTGGHVAGWVGVGGPGQGPNGEDAWIQSGIASLPGMAPFVYAEITRPGRHPQFMLVESDVGVGSTRDIAVLEMGRRHGWWRVWVDGQAVTRPVKLRGSSGRWAPIATAESLTDGSGCNRFSFRFERVSVSYGGGGSWRPFVPGYRFLDGGNRLRPLTTTVPAERGVYARSLSSDSPAPYAFLATSGLNR